MSDKTEKPTPKRLEDAKKKGQVAKSKEIATTAVIVGLFGYLWMFGENYIERIKYLLLVPAQYYEKPFEQAFTACLKNMTQEFVLLTLPFALIAAAIAALSYLLQIGFLVSFEPIKPELKKINPVEGFKRIFSLSNLLELLKSVVKILLLGAIIFWLIKSSIKSLPFISRGDLLTPLTILVSILKKLTIAISALFIVVAILDYFFQKHLHIRKLRMSKHEVKREYIDREGDPRFKSHRKNIHREAAMDNMVAKIRSSTLAVTDAKRVAVILYYEMGKTPIPILSAKGESHLASRIIALAEKHELPIINDPALARGLYSECDQDNYIASAFVEPVAIILRDIIGTNSSANQ